MISDPDIYRAAKLLIEQHGADAGLRAALLVQRGVLAPTDMTPSAVSIVVTIQPSIVATLAPTGS